MQEENEQIQDSADTQSQVLEQMQQEELRRAVERLEPKYKTPIILMYTFGMKVEEIAKIEHLPQATVKTRLRRARQKLKTEMEERGYGI